MPLLVHLAPEPFAKRIRRSGIRPTRFDFEWEGIRQAVWAFPLLESYTLTHQWSRELKRKGARTLVAVTFRLPDDEPVLVHHYNAPPERRPAAEAVAVIRAMPDPRGGQVLITRRIAPDEIVRVRVLAQHFGWRYWPQAKEADRRPCDCPMCAPRGEVKAKRYRDRIPALARRWDARHSQG
jgi:hypothetical protein